MRRVHGVVQIAVAGRHPALEMPDPGAAERLVDRRPVTDPVTERAATTPAYSAKRCAVSRVTQPPASAAPAADPSGTASTNGVMPGAEQRVDEPVVELEPAGLTAPLPRGWTRGHATENR